MTDTPIPPATEDDLRLDLEDLYRKFTPANASSYANDLVTGVIRLAHHHQQIAEAKGLPWPRYEIQQERITTLEAALREIAEDPHTDYYHKDVAGAGEYSTGIADGHRCAAKKARRALTEVSDTEENPDGR